jgi:hypothetical protein
MKSKKGATMFCTDCGICVGNLEKDMYNHQCKTNDIKNYKKFLKYILKSEKNKT